MKYKALFKFGLFLMVVAMGIIGFGADSHAVQMRLADFSPDGSVIYNSIYDNGSGLATFNGTFGIFNVNVTATTPPVDQYSIYIPGVQNSPMLYLDSFVTNPSGQAGHVLEILATGQYYFAGYVGEPDNSNPNGTGIVNLLLGAFGNTSGGDVYVTAYLGWNNSPFETSQLVATIAPPSGSGFSENALGLGYTNGRYPYSLTLDIDFHDPGSSNVSAQVGAVPEPATLLLLGSGLFGMGIFGRKKVKKTKS